jgi:hypothetical protein
LAFVEGAADEGVEALVRASASAPSTPLREASSSWLRFAPFGN